MTSIGWTIVHALTPSVWLSDLPAVPASSTPGRRAFLTTLCGTCGYSHTKAAPLPSPCNIAGVKGQEEHSAGLWATVVPTGQLGGQDNRLQDGIERETNCWAWTHGPWIRGNLPLFFYAYPFISNKNDKIEPKFGP